MAIPTKVFISTPISSFTEGAKYARLKNWLNTLINRIESTSYEISIFCAASNVPSLTQTDEPFKSVLIDIAHLDECTHFVLIFPEKLPSVP
jgi:hypothetical protein